MKKPILKIVSHFSVKVFKVLVKSLIFRYKTEFVEIAKMTKNYMNILPFSSSYPFISYINRYHDLHYKLIIDL